MIYNRYWKLRTGIDFSVTFKDGKERITTRKGTLVFAGPKSMIFHAIRTGCRFSIPTPSVMEMKEVH